MYKSGTWYEFGSMRASGAVRMALESRAVWDCGAIVVALPPLSPSRGGNGHARTANAWRLYERVTGHTIGAPEVHEPLRRPPPVSTTSIFSRTDRIVSWKCSGEREGPFAENVEFEASRSGLGPNPLTFCAIADRLAQPEGEWLPFARSGFRAWLCRDTKRRGRL